MTSIKPHATANGNILNKAFAFTMYHYLFILCVLFAKQAHQRQFQHHGCDMYGLAIAASVPATRGRFFGLAIGVGDCFTCTAHLHNSNASIKYGIRVLLVP